MTTYAYTVEVEADDQVSADNVMHALAYYAHENDDSFAWTRPVVPGDTPGAATTRSVRESGTAKIAAALSQAFEEADQ
jgi:hypothetical protein